MRKIQWEMSFGGFHGERKCFTMRVPLELLSYISENSKTCRSHSPNVLQIKFRLIYCHVVVVTVADHNGASVQSHLVEIERKTN